MAFSKSGACPRGALHAQHGTHLWRRRAKSDSAISQLTRRRTRRLFAAAAHRDRSLDECSRPFASRWRETRVRVMIAPR
jgi:hypothetical protein